MKKVPDKIIHNGKEYLSTRFAARLSGYHPDYIGQLTRAGGLEETRIGRSHFVARDALFSLLENKRRVPPSLLVDSLYANAPAIPLATLRASAIAAKQMSATAYPPEARTDTESYTTDMRKDGVYNETPAPYRRNIQFFFSVIIVLVVVLFSPTLETMLAHVVPAAAHSDPSVSERSVLFIGAVGKISAHVTDVMQHAALLAFISRDMTRTAFAQAKRQFAYQLSDITAVLVINTANFWERAGMRSDNFFNASEKRVMAATGIVGERGLLFFDTLDNALRTHLNIRFPGRVTRFLKRGDAADAEMYWKYIEAEPQAAAENRVAQPKWNFEMGSSRFALPAGGLFESEIFRTALLRGAAEASRTKQMSAVFLNSFSDDIMQEIASVPASFVAAGELMAHIPRMMKQTALAAAATIRSLSITSPVRP